MKFSGKVGNNNCQSIKDVVDKKFKISYIKKYSVSRNGVYKLFT